MTKSSKHGIGNKLSCIPAQLIAKMTYHLKVLGYVEQVIIP
jgi:hypothetical protein